MHRFNRIFKYPEHRCGRLYALAANADAARQMMDTASRLAPLASVSAGTVHVFSERWAGQYPHLHRIAGPGSAATQGDSSAWFNGRYSIAVDERRLLEAVGAAQTDLVSVTVCPALQSGRELVRLTAADHVAGYRRLYEDTAEPAPLNAWPHVIFVFDPDRAGALQDLFFRADVSSFKQAVAAGGLSWLHLKMGGRVLDLESEQGLAAIAGTPVRAAPAEANPDSRMLPSLRLRMLRPHTGIFRQWPFFSYARLGKRIFDIAASSCILLIILPLLLAVAVLVKLTSQGPVFYRARRQGLHGKPFDCLKFRTMMVQAEAIQYRLRVVNQVDGPQFKIENDPRITGIGKFLRDTCIDELPQFFNVLMGQMSIAGPRPSPANENESCPWWRDARLSVRPGITGLWQVCRTRRNSMDFQEWVYYDTRYVKKLSFRLDLYICFKTALKLIGNFLDQFG